MLKYILLLGLNICLQLCFGDESPCPITHDQGYLLNEQVKREYDKTYPGDLKIVGKNWGCYRSLRDDYVENKKMALYYLLKEWEGDEDACRLTFEYLAKARVRVNQIKLVNEKKCVPGCTNLYCKVELKSGSGALADQSLPVKPKAEEVSTKNQENEDDSAEFKEEGNGGLVKKEESETRSGEQKNEGPKSNLIKRYRRQSNEVQNEERKVLKNVLQQIDGNDGKIGNVALETLKEIGNLLLESELNVSPKEEFPKVLDPVIFQTFDQSKKSLNSFKDEKNIRETIEKMISSIYHNFTNEYETVDLEENPYYSKRILDFLDGHGGNCRANTRMIVSLLLAQGLKLPDHMILGVQTFADHVQPVIFNTKTNKTWSLVNNAEVEGVESDIYHPAIILDADLKSQNKNGIDSKKLLLFPGDRRPDEKDLRAKQLKIESRKKEKRIVLLDSTDGYPKTQIYYNLTGKPSPRSATNPFNEKTISLDRAGDVEKMALKKDAEEKKVRDEKVEQLQAINGERSDGVAFSINSIPAGENNQVELNFIAGEDGKLEVALPDNLKKGFDQLEGLDEKKTFILKELLEQKEKAMKEFSERVDALTPEELTSHELIEELYTKMSIIMNSFSSTQYSQVYSVSKDSQGKSIYPKVVTDAMEKEKQLKNKFKTQLNKAFHKRPAIFVNKVSSHSNYLDRIELLSGDETEFLEKIKTEFLKRKARFSVDSKTIVDEDWGTSVQDEPLNDVADISKGASTAGEESDWNLDDGPAKGPKGKKSKKGNRIKINRKNTQLRNVKNMALTPLIALNLALNKVVIKGKESYELEKNLITGMTLNAKKALNDWREIGLNPPPHSIVDLLKKCEKLNSDQQGLSSEQRKIVLYLKDWAQNSLKYIEEQKKLLEK